MHEAGRRVEGEDLRRIAQHQNVFPGHEDIVEHQDGVVLVETRRQRIVEGLTGAVGGLFVGDTAEHLDARRVHRDDEHHRQRGILGHRRGALGEEIVMRQRRGGGDDLGAGDINPGVSFLGDVNEDVLHGIRRLMTVDWRIDDRVVHEQHAFLGALVPGESVVLERAVPVGIGAERVHQRRLVVGGAAHPAIGHAGPIGDCALLGDQVVRRFGNPEIFVGIAARAGIGRRGQPLLRLLVVQGVIHPGDGAGGVAHRGMGGDVGDALAIDIDFAAVPEAGQIYRRR